MNKAIFLDRDGTINVDYGYVYQPEKLDFLPGVIEALQTFCNLGYQLIVITNQSGIGRGYYTMDDALRFNQAMSQHLNAEGITVTDYYICPHAPHEVCHCRKPQPTMVLQALSKHHINPEESYMFGDKASDVACGENSGIKSYLVTPEHNLLYWANQLKEKQI